MKKTSTLLAFFALSLLTASPAWACTNVLVTRGASKSGSTMVSYSADSHTLYGALYSYPAADHPAGAMRKIYEWDTGKYLGQIPEVAHTYSVVGNMNEHQVLIGESTWGGIERLVDTTAVMDYGSLMYVALQRAKTAREALDVMIDLVTRYGYASSGESISIADPTEVWILEIIGKGTKMVKGQNVNKGAVWAAVRLPDGAVSAHANQSRITSIPTGDPNYLCSRDVISFARAEGLFNGKDEEFSFSEVYNPFDFSGMRGCEARVWSVFRQIAPGMDQYLDYALGKNPKNRMPLWVFPDRKLDVSDVAAFMRNHYEGTPLNMTSDPGAGGNLLPYRWRPMTFKVDGDEFTNERAIATQQTGWWYVGECRSWLPDPVGGVLWFGVDDADSSPLTPFYCGINRVPWAYDSRNGHMTQYSSTSMFWAVNRVTNFGYLRYNHIHPDIKRAMDRYEQARMGEQTAIDQVAATLYKQDPARAIEFLTDYCVNSAQGLFQSWVELDHYLLVKFIDGNTKKESSEGVFIDNGNGANIPVSPLFPGYSDAWKEDVKQHTGEHLRVVQPE